MANWRQLSAIWQLRPAEPTGLIEFIGGSYLAATPQISYRRLLEDLAAGQEVSGDTSTLEDRSVLDRLRA